MVLLADKLLLSLASDVVPHTVGSDPGAVLVVVAVVRLPCPEVGEGDAGAIHPGEVPLVQEVSQSNPGPIRASEGIESILLLLGLHPGQGPSFPLALQDGGQIVGGPRHHLDTRPAYVCVASTTPSTSTTTLRGVCC